MDNLNKSFWNHRWQTGQTGWDIGYASPAIVEYFSQIQDKSAKILIPGCGNAYEAEALYKMGFKQITLVDISDEAVKILKNKFEKYSEIEIVCEDFFNHSGTYQYIVEQTFFCALHTELRKKYVEKMHDLLEPNGILMGLLFNINFEKEGPPFGGLESEYRDLFEAKFELLKLSEATNSIRPRLGNELFIEFKAK